ncbi:DUF2971 domain-containing protein [Chryseobacterium sp. JAH]|uniref:DUF2971 domain-containing protein n=1 Tax=Chryseobacterium sp. JAH TaxID=1742858 RepID=UPI0007413232|nr:DUF2971 domain-containing protein [Chryseobacterium sp. JAH]KUJ51806.1 hypothetical protein AR685_09230 [Chryseobacterium sp. JAH]
MKAYKYRSIEEDIFKRDFKTLASNTFYSPNYTTLNDPFDIYFGEQISPLIKILNKVFPSNDSSNFEKQFKSVLNSKEEAGIYCLSKHFLNEQLWAYYASSYSGYCIEYDLEKLVDKGQNFDFQYQFEVDYKDDIPTLKINDIIERNINFIRKMFATKKSTWKHEEEIRLIFDKYGVKKFHPSAITGIYFGIKTPEIIKESFYGLYKDMDVKFYEVFPSNFKLDFKLINETKRKLKYDISKFQFDILDHTTNVLHEIYYIFYNHDIDSLSIKEFILAFREKYCVKENTLYLFNNKEAKSFINVLQKSEKEYIFYADSIITVSDSGEDIDIYNPLKDFKYNEIMNKNK